MELTLDEKSNRIVIEPVPAGYPESIDKEFADQIGDFVRRYKPALKALAS